MEHSFTCPFCGEVISMVLDNGADSVTYVEDCEVCCNPLEITYTIEDETLVHFEARTLELVRPFTCLMVPNRYPITRQCRATMTGCAPYIEQPCVVPDLSRTSSHASAFKKQGQRPSR